MMDWIKVRADIFEDATVLKLSDICRTEDAHTVGLLVRFWSWAGRQTAEGEHIEITAARLDKLVGHPGFAAALLSVGWLTGTDGDYSIPDFQRHNGQCAKARALEAEAKRIRRKDKDRPDKMSDKCRTNSDPNVGPEKRREEKIDVLSLSPAGARPGLGQVLPEATQAKIRTILAAYPKNQGYYEAEQHLADQALEGIDLDMVLRKTQAIAVVIETRPPAERLRIPAANTFFLNRRYFDDPTTWLSARSLEPARGAKQTINDYDKPDEWTQEQMTLGEPTP